MERRFKRHATKKNLSDQSVPHNQYQNNHRQLGSRYWPPQKQDAPTSAPSTKTKSRTKSKKKSNNRSRPTGPSNAPSAFPSAHSLSSSFPHILTKHSQPLPLDHPHRRSFDERIRAIRNNRKALYPDDPRSNHPPIVLAKAPRKLASGHRHAYSKFSRQLRFAPSRQIASFGTTRHIVALKELYDEGETKFLYHLSPRHFAPEHFYKVTPTVFLHKLSIRYIPGLSIDGMGTYAVLLLFGSAFLNFYGESDEEWFRLISSFPSARINYANLETVVEWTFQAGQFPLKPASPDQVACTFVLVTATKSIRPDDAHLVVTAHFSR